jgi:general secretion pathway protein D
MSRQKPYKNIYRLLTCCAVSLSLLATACSETGFDSFADGDPVDRKLRLSRSDYRDFYDQEKEAALSEKPTANAADKPLDLAPVLAAPRPPKLGETKLVSLAVTDDVPLKDVLIELSKLADIDLEMDANIEGGITFRAKDRPFNEVIERISSLAGLRYTYKGGVLRVERDLPYIENYPLDFLNFVRSSTSNTNISTDILSVSNQAAGGGGGAGAGGGGASAGGGGGGGAGGGGAGSGLTTGSTTTIDTTASDDFWLAMEANIRSILLQQAPRHLSGEDSENPQDLAAQTAAAAAAGAGGAAAGGAGGAGVVTNMIGNSMFYALNRQAGILSVAATDRQHESIRSYLDYLRRGATAQVLIEAKVVEVELEERFQSGIDWSLLQQKIGSGQWNVATSFGQSGFDNSNLVRIALNPNDPNANINTVLNLTELFGTTRTLSSPRLHAINNQPAVLTFAENRVFFEVDVQRQPDVIDPNGQVRPGQLTIGTNRRSIPIGIILNILPSINIDTNEVTLSVRPTLTRQVDEVIDPGSAFASRILIDDPEDRFVNTVPIVEVRELDSIMRLQSGQVMVIGGLMEQKNSNTDNGVPYMSGIPFVGNLFKGVDKQSSNKELIIFIKASIVTPEKAYHQTDKKVYQKYTDDPRPIAF